MGIVTWIVLGLVAGLIARWLMPGPEGGGLLVTILLGIAGGLVGGFIGTQIGFGDVHGFDIRSLFLAIGGAMLLLIGYRQLKKNRLL